MTETRAIAGKQIEMFQIPGGRWVFDGSLNPMGYLTADDAAVEAELQLTNQAQGRLATGRVDVKVHRANWRKHVAPLMNRRH